MFFGAETQNVYYDHLPTARLIACKKCCECFFFFLLLSFYFNHLLAIISRGVHYPTPLGWGDERPWQRGWFINCVTYICQNGCIIFIFCDVWFFRKVILYLAHFLCLLRLVRICSNLCSAYWDNGWQYRKCGLWKDLKNISKIGLFSSKILSFVLIYRLSFITLLDFLLLSVFVHVTRSHICIMKQNEEFAWR